MRPASQNSALPPEWRRRALPAWRASCGCPAAIRGGGGRRDRRSSASLRRGDDEPAGRPPRSAGRSRGLDRHAGDQPRQRHRALRARRLRRSRRRAHQPDRRRRDLPADRGVHARAAAAPASCRSPSAATIWSPIRSSAPSGASGPARARPHRRPQRYRRRAIRRHPPHARHPVPPGDRGRRSRSAALRPDRHPRQHGFGRRARLGLRQRHADHHHG